MIEFKARRGPGVAIPIELVRDKTKWLPIFFHFSLYRIVFLRARARRRLLGNRLY